MRKEKSTLLLKIPQKLHLPLMISINAQVMLEAQRNNSYMTPQLLPTMNIFMEKVTRKKTDVVDSPVNQSPTTSLLLRRRMNLHPSVPKNLGGQLPQSPSRALIVVVLLLKRDINHHIGEKSRCTTHQRHHSRQAPYWQTYSDSYYCFWDH
ncbi:hypothetical protein JCGZ_08993 [Jatropha curcas]|uniref:Uncharacterized protein n=1 Tax=Jatropha curcas TaxID=180498 RepID=A0A067KTE8_JATCU|nr:hypothetical protein JCGZ_08993 [Jatropha curcas]